MNDINLAIAAFCFVWFSLGIAYNAVRAYRWIMLARKRERVAPAARPPIDWEALVEDYLDARITSTHTDPWDQMEVMIAMDERRRATIH